MLTSVAGPHGRAADPFAQIIHREQSWFDVSGPGPVRTRIVASRWSGYTTGRSEHTAEIEADCHVISKRHVRLPRL
jgi:hypothetical protein